MKNLSKWLKKSLWQVREGFLKNLGVVISAFILSGGYLVAINKIQKFRTWIRNIPTDWVLTPSVLLLVGLVLLLRINYKQRLQLTSLERQQRPDDSKAKFVTHLGVWWKIYPDSKYIEDFPYCPCCEPKKKLVQTEWFPNEVYKCPTTGTEIKLFDEIPRKRNDVLRGLYNSYFEYKGIHLQIYLNNEFNRIKELHPDKDEKDILLAIFNEAPLNKLPEKDREEILQCYHKPHEVFHFINRNYSKYEKYFNQQKKE